MFKRIHYVIYKIDFSFQFNVCVCVLLILIAFSEIRTVCGRSFYAYVIFGICVYFNKLGLNAKKELCVKSLKKKTYQYQCFQFLRDIYTCRMDSISLFFSPEDNLVQVLTF